MQPNTMYEVPKSEKKARSWIFWVVIGIVVLALVAAAVYAFTVIVPRMAEESKVKDELITQNLRLKANNNEGVLDNASITGIQSTDRATIQLVVAPNQKDYCLQAVSLSKPSEIQYHMTQGTPDQSPIKGFCGDAATEVPSQPQGVTIGSVGGTSIVLGWVPIPDTKEYIAECSVSDTFTEVFKSNASTEPKAIIEELAGNTNYYCRVSAINSKGSSEWSATITAKTADIAPVPKNLTITTLSSTSLSYEWDAVEGATQYILEYSTDASFMKDTKQIITTQTKGEIKDLEVYTGYFFHVKAITPSYNQNQAPYSPIVQGRTTQ